MARRSFSLMLAWRYLNPRRAMLSAVAMISVIGVMLGVLALVVVMSVYSGMEREVKERFLGFIPHVQLDYAPEGTEFQSIANWREMAKKVEQIPGVIEANPVIQDTLLIDVDGRRLPGTYQAVDTTSEAAVAGLEAMLDKDVFPESSADMGMDDRVVVSSQTARQFGLMVGDKINLLTMRNLREVEHAFRVTERPLVREEFAEALEKVRNQAKEKWKEEEPTSILSTDDFNAIYIALQGIIETGPREAEANILFRALMFLDEAENDATAKKQKFAMGAKSEFLSILDELNKIQREKIDAETLKDIKEFVLPREAEVVGIYAASQMALTPSVFMPLHMAQELSGLDGEVQAIGVRLADPYQGRAVAQRIAKSLEEEGWYVQAWMDVESMRQFSILIEQQRVMMYFVLSFIVLVSAFSMTAVMFTVTIQKRREIGVMKALGAAPGQIVRVFVYQGMVLGVLGSLIGVVAGLIVIGTRAQLQEALRRVGFDPFPASFNGFSVLPAHINPVEVVVIAIAAFLLCTLAALLPASFAAKNDAAKSLRNL